MYLIYRGNPSLFSLFILEWNSQMCNQQQQNNSLARVERVFLISTANTHAPNIQNRGDGEGRAEHRQTLQDGFERIPV